MKKNKKGFTLGEVLVCITIIGVVMAMSVNSIKIVKASYTALTYFTFKNLQNMVGTIYSGRMVYTDSAARECHENSEGVKTCTYIDPKECGKNGHNCEQVTVWGSNWVKNEAGELVQENKNLKNAIYVKKNADGSDAVGFDLLLNPNKKIDNLNEIDSDKYLPSAVGACRNEKGMIENVLKNDEEYNWNKIIKCSSRSKTNPVTYPLFCSSLAGVANITGAPRCSYADLYDVGFDTNDKPYITNLPVGTGITSTPPDKPNFVTSNGQMYYISKWDKDARVSSIFGFRIVAIDVNGKSRPNKFAVTGNKNAPDIVSFLVLDNGEVFPLGVAADNLQKGDRVVRYLNARVKGYYMDANRERYTAEDLENLEKKGTINVPVECIKLGKCNFSVVPVKTTRTDAADDYFMSYRDAYCLSHDHSTLSYTSYCAGTSVTKSPYCPPASYNSSEGIQPFDNCIIETVKPAFRYNLK